ncbi:MAG: 4Fe-4S binding protein [Candidatus Marinimicrobia bacterium]|nr:4Fe-4S binding protein [Candidatus Neomarinimicrobiota bacterium]
MSKNIFHNKTKLVFQTLILALIVGLLIVGAINDSKADFEAYCPFGGLISLGSKFNLGSMSCSMSEVQVFMGITLLAMIILIGKLFCGYICPIGTITDWLNKLLARFKISVVLTGWIDKVLRIGKYILLFFAAYMTATHSELWCKNFDPYFAIVSGFNVDVATFWAIAAIFTVIVLSVLIRFFWCKYVCPLGALSNIFANFYITVPIFIVYFLLRIIGIELSILWLILTLCISGAATEIFRFRFYSITPCRIHINKKLCTNCNQCSAHCPQGIEVNSYEKVTHPDCTLCLDCVKSCKIKGSISVCKSKGTWIPPVAIIVFFLMGLFAAKNYEFKTLSERWGDYDSLKTVSKIEFENLKSIKCWGSSKSLQGKLEMKKGIVGLDTWARTHRIAVYYDNTILDSMGVKAAIFTPSRNRTSNFKDYKPQKIAVLHIGIYGVMDVYDSMNLLRLLIYKDGVCGFETSFGEPVMVNIFYDEEKVQPKEIIEQIHQKSYIRKIKDKEEVVSVDFKCENDGKVTEHVTYTEMRKRLFNGYDQKFNGYENYPEKSLRIYEIGLENADNIAVKRNLKYLTSHVSGDTGIVRLKTDFVERGEVVHIYFNPSMVKVEKISTLLKAPNLVVYTSNGEMKKFTNSFEFVGKGVVLKP